MLQDENERREEVWARNFWDITALAFTGLAVVIALLLIYDVIWGGDVP